MKALFKTSVFLTLAIAMISCGPKELETATSEIEGQLNGAYQLVEGTYPIEKDGDNYLVKVKIKRTNQSVPFVEKTVGGYGEKALTNAGFGFILLDENNKEVYEYDAEEGGLSPEQQTKVLNLKPGQEGELTLIYSNKVKAKSFKLTSNICFNSTGIIPMEGSVGKYGVKNFWMEFNFKNQEIQGQYQYLTSPPGAYLYMFGRNETESMKPGKYVFKVAIADMNSNGDLSGRIWGKLLLVRDSEDQPYRYQLACEFLNFKYDTYNTNISSAPIDKLYQDLEKPSWWDADKQHFYDYSKEIGFDGPYN